MTFDVAAESYDRFMGRYSALLAPVFAEFAEVRAGQWVLDVGCGPGALTGELARRLGPERVAAVDPSSPFVEAARARFPGVDVRQAAAEELPFPDAGFDAALAQLVVHFMADPVAGIAEMARVVLPGGTVAACVWDFAGGTGPLGAFWSAALEVVPDAIDESGLAGAREGHLVELFESAGLVDVEPGELTVSLEHQTFDEWWEPFTRGVGPAGAFVQRLDTARRDELRERCRARLSDGPFTITARAWAARGTA
jgi:SAM-dependent methyltransferase